MRSPFPGMDPYLEQEVVWHDFHERFIPAAAAHLASQVLPRYIVLIDENVYLHEMPQEESRLAGRPDLSVARIAPPEVQGAATGVLEAPVQVLMPEQDVEREAFLGIRDRLSRELVTVVELLSPANKRPGENREKYLAKRSSLLNSPVHLMEIDLLRGGPPLPARNRPDCDYSVLVSRAERRPQADFWPIGLRNPLPTVPVPLRAGDGDARLDLRAILDRVYGESGYQFYIYQREPDPPLAGDASTWALTLISPKPEALEEAGHGEAP
jgi:Protein of unknown function (DUF4058)